MCEFISPSHHSYFSFPLHANVATAPIRKGRTSRKTQQTPDSLLFYRRLYKSMHTYWAGDISITRMSPCTVPSSILRQSSSSSSQTLWITVSLDGFWITILNTFTQTQRLIHNPFKDALEVSKTTRLHLKSARFHHTPCSPSKRLTLIIPVTDR